MFCPCTIALFNCILEIFKKRTCLKNVVWVIKNSIFIVWIWRGEGGGGGLLSPSLWSVMCPPCTDTSWLFLLFSGADPGFFLGGGAPLRNDVTDRWDKQISKGNTKKKASSQRGGVRIPCTLPLDPPLLFMHILVVVIWVPTFKHLLNFWLFYVIRVLLLVSLKVIPLK